MMKKCEVNSIGELIKIEFGIRHKQRSIGNFGTIQQISNFVDQNQEKQRTWVNVRVLCSLV